MANMRDKMRSKASIFYRQMLIRILSLVLAAAMLFSLLTLTTACGNKKAEEFEKYVACVTAYDDSSGIVRDVAYGSAVMVYADGGVSHFITNYHVIQKGNGVSLSLGNLRLNAEVLGYSEYHDIAVLKVSSDFGMSGTNLGDEIVTTVAKQDEELYSLGNLNNEGISMHEGKLLKNTEIVSADSLTDRGGNKYVPTVKVSCNIGDGKSGGAVVTADGELVGIGTYASDNGEYYAVAADIAVAVYNAVISGEQNGNEVTLIKGSDYTVTLTDAYGGFSFLSKPFYPNSLTGLGFTASITSEGIRVIKTGSENHPLKSGDLIVKWNGIDAVGVDINALFVDIYSCEVSGGGEAISLELDGGKVVKLTCDGKVFGRSAG